jgi:flavin-dependent dehydrogenase
VKLIGSNPVRGVVDADGTEHHASVVVGADGRRSTVARLVAAPKELDHPAARLLLYRYVSGYTNAKGEPGPEFSLLGNEMAYAFPSDHGFTCIALTVPLDASQVVRANLEAFFDTRLAEHQGIWPRYRASTPHGRIVAGRPSDDYVRRAAGPGWALVGDSGTHQDPWSGAGMDTAARQARVLADALASGGSDWPARYAVARDEVTLDRYRDTVATAPDLSVLLAD